MQLSGQKMKLIDSGNCSQIYCYGQGESRLVLKMVPIQFHRQCQHLKNEWELLRELNHKHILKVLSYKEQVDTHGKAQNTQLRDVRNVLITEYAQNSTLLHYCRQNKLSIAFIKKIFRTIATTVLFLHHKNIAHRDLKLENIFMFQHKGQVNAKIGDFGFASKSNKLYNDYKGTRKAYMAPQIHRVMHEKKEYYNAETTDIFALGVILFALMLGKLPFQYAHQGNKLYNLLINEKKQEFWSHHSAEISKIQSNQGASIEKFKELFEQMVKYQPSFRISMKQVVNCEWLSS